MSEGLAALFRPTGHSTSARLGVPVRRTSATADDSRGLPSEASEYLRRFLWQVDHRSEVVASGFVELDARLAGGFGRGLHVALAQREAIRTAFLDSMVWECVTSRRPVLCYSLREGSLGAWERLIHTLGCILGDVTAPIVALRARSLDTFQLDTLMRLDAVFRKSMLPFLSLIDTIPLHPDMASSLLEDIRFRAAESEGRHGKSPLVLVDDLGHLLALAGPRPAGQLLAYLDSALVTDSLTGVIASSPLERSSPSFGGLPTRTTLILAETPGFLDDDLARVDLEVVANTRTGWTGTLPLVLDRHSRLLSHCPSGASNARVWR